MMAAADILVSWFVGILAGLGVGSGGLLIVYLTEVEKMGQLTAQGLNLAVFVFALGTAVLVHLHRRQLPAVLLAFLLVFGALGAFCGSMLARVVDASWLRFFLGVLLLGMGTLALFRK